jgi:hypothetical protein
MRLTMSLSGQRAEIGPTIGVEGDLIAFHFRKDISHVACGAMPARYVPAAPTLFEWGGMIGQRGAALEQDLAFPVGKDGADENAGDAIRHASAVAVHAIIRSVETLDLAIGAGGEEVKDRP